MADTKTWFMLNKNNEIVRMVDAPKPPPAKNGYQWVDKVAQFRINLFILHGAGK